LRMGSDPDLKLGNEEDQEEGASLVGEVSDFVLGRDYELEEGRCVMTAAFLMARGKCCQQGCRNCPWRQSRKHRIGNGFES
jgi:hypothetical protein